LLSQTALVRRSICVNATSEIAEAGETCSDLETIFRAQYERIARVIARVVRDRARAEELAVEVFLKWWRNPQAHGAGAQGWLYRTAVRMALDELRKQTRRSRYEGLFGFMRHAATPEEVRATHDEQSRVRAVLGAMDRRGAELLVLRTQGLSYEELATALGLNPASVGTLLSRAQQAFRKEYIQRYEEE
jgi:RNA polymerase sigma-70 factor (ECF subfamily)